MNIAGKRQWYDGRLYGWFFDSIEGANRRMVLDFIPEGCTVLDVCCGTGRLALEMAEKCRHVTGIDISSRMMAFAEKQKNRRGVKNLDFVFGDSARLEECLDRRYDVAVVSLALHEMGPDERHATVCSMAAVADRLVVSDHATPQPSTVPGFVIIQMERFIGGKANFALFKEYLDSGGILGALDRCGLTADEECRDWLGIRQVVTAVTGNHV